jgi:hypothetical protein
VDCSLPRRRWTDTHVGVVDLPSGTEHAAGGASARPGYPTLTTLYLQLEKETEAALGLPPNVHSYALLPIGYPMGRLGQSAASLSAMSSRKTGGASLSGICSDPKYPVDCRNAPPAQRCCRPAMRLPDTLEGCSPPSRCDRDSL